MNRPLISRWFVRALFGLLIAVTPACSVWHGFFGGDDGASRGPRTVIPLRDIENRKLKIGDGDLYVVVGVTTRGLQSPAIPEGILAPNLLADPELRLLYIVDLDGKLPAAFNSSIRRELAKVLSRERKRLEQAHRRLGFKRKTEDAISLVFDPEGETSGLLGLGYGKSAHAVVIFDRSGNRAWSCQGLPQRNELLKRLSAVKMGRIVRDPEHPGSPHVGELHQRPASATPAVGRPTEQPTPTAPYAKPAGYAAALNRAEAIAKNVPNGRLTRFAETMLSFVPARPTPRFGAPGALEDAAIASNARAKMADIPGVNPRRIRIKCEMGSVTIEGVPARDELIAAFASAALAVEGVAEVRVAFE